MLVFDLDKHRASAPPHGPVQPISNNLKKLPFVFHYKHFDFSSCLNVKTPCHIQAWLTSLNFDISNVNLHHTSVFIMNVNPEEQNKRKKGCSWQIKVSN